MENRKGAEHGEGGRGALPGGGEGGGGFILEGGPWGGTPNDGWDLNRARWEKAETGPDTAATPCNVIESHSVVQIHYSSQFLFISGARLHCIAEHLHRVLPWLYFSAVNTFTVASPSSNNM